MLSQVLFCTVLGCQTLLSKHEVSCKTGGVGGGGEGGGSSLPPPGANGQACGLVS